MRHMEYSGKDFRVLDDATHEKYIPNVVETSAGADRLALVALLDAYEEIEGGRTQTTKSTKEKEVVLRFHPRLAPIKVAVFPLAKKPEIQKIAREVFVTLQKNWMSAYDAGGSVGRRYRRQDEIGTPFCVTVDFESVEKQTVTVRDRDTMQQDRVAVGELLTYFSEKLS